LKFIDYYQQEIRYFLEEAQRFALQYPEQAKALNLEEVRERDPYVERLIEAFAFLSANINMRINDDFSDLAKDLIDIIWPHYLCRLPGALILQFTPIPGRLKGVRHVEAGGYADTRAVSTGQPCRFSTTGPVCLRPLQINKADLIGRRDGRSALRINLSGFKGSEWKDMGVEPIRVYLHGDPGFAFSLYYMMLEDTVDVRIKYIKSGNEVEQAIPLSRIRGTAFDPDNDFPLLPYPVNSFPGFRLLEEYFFFPEKFRFIDLDMMDFLLDADNESPVQVDFILSGKNEWRIQPDAYAFRLHCVPAVNLYPKSAEPIRLVDAVPLYKIVADQANSDHHVPHHIRRVEGIRLNSAQRYVYESFSSYRHESRTSVEQGYYHVKRRNGVDGNPEILIGLHRPLELGPEILSIDLMCSNDRVIREVRLGDLMYPGDNLPDCSTLSNITVPKAPSWPDLQGRQVWTLVNHLALNYVSMEDPVKLRSLLTFYDREQGRANRRRVESISDISIYPTQTLLKGCPLRGVNMEILLKAEHFTGRGDLLLFSYIMSRVMAMYVTINSFCDLTIKETNSEKTYHWPGIKGIQAIL
jgi:type VI secretion system protein ImpG